jgi:hypothetical protein
MAVASIEKLSDLTPEVVDHLFGIDRAEPVADPTFTFIVGVPGIGKSSVHPRAASGHATINLDTLLEGLVPFRAASAIAHATESKQFSSIIGYGSRKENLGMFNWYDRLEGDKDPAFNALRAHFAPLHGKTAPASIIDIAAAAIQRAIQKHINLVYETTVRVTARTGRITKVDDVLRALPAEYRVRVIHLTGDPDEVATRAHARQEYQMPYGPRPFQRRVDTERADIVKLMEAIHDGVKTLRRQYAGRIEFEEREVRLDPARLPPARKFSPRGSKMRTMAAYGPNRNRTLRSSWRISTPRSSSSNLFRLSSSSSGRRRTRKASSR